MLRLLLLAVLIQAQVFPSHPGRPARALVVGTVGAAHGETEPGFSMRLAKELKKHCPQVTVIADAKEADYVAIFDEGMKYDITVLRGKEVIHASSSSWSVKTVVKNACKAIQGDWKAQQEKTKKEIDQEKD